MKDIEEFLKENLSEEPLREPSVQVDERLLKLIAEHEANPKSMKVKSSWAALSIAASLLIVTLYFGSSVLMNTNSQSELDIALESSRQLENSISQLESSHVSALAFMEISKLNSQIAKIDQNIQLLILDNLDDGHALDLINERIKKLALVKSLYSSSSSLVRI